MASNTIINGRFRILEKCGKGSQAQVFKVVDLEDNIIKAAKKINILSQDTDIAENELATLKRLNSEYIVKYLGFYSDANFYYIITKYYEDGTLDDIISDYRNECKLMPEERVQHWGIQLLKSIDFLHRNNIIHRDIKPSNVLLHKNELVLGDLGLARDISILTRSSLTTGIGTYPYMSPEVVTESKNYTNKIDIWAFGCVLYEMIRLKRLFASENFMEIINAISNFRNDNLNLSHMNPTFQKALRRSIAKESYQRLPAVYLIEILMDFKTTAELREEENFDNERDQFNHENTLDEQIEKLDKEEDEEDYSQEFFLNAENAKLKRRHHAKLLIHTLIGHTGSVTSLTVLKDGHLVSGSCDETIGIWNPETGTLIRKLTGHTRFIRCLAVLKTGFLVSGSGDNTIKIWDPYTGALNRTLLGHSKGVLCLAVLKNNLLASGSFDNTIRIWDADSGALIRTLAGHSGTIYSLVVLHNGCLVSGSADCTIKIWYISNGVVVRTLAGHTSIVWTLALLSNGNLASGSDDKTIKLWVPGTGTLLQTLVGHIGYVECLTVLTDGLLASGSGNPDYSIKIWDTNSGALVRTLPGHKSTVCYLCTLLNGFLVSGSRDNTIRIWNPNAES